MVMISPFFSGVCNKQGGHPRPDIDYLVEAIGYGFLKITVNLNGYFSKSFLISDKC